MKSRKPKDWGGEDPPRVRVVKETRGDAKRRATQARAAGARGANGPDTHLAEHATATHRLTPHELQTCMPTRQQPHTARRVAPKKD